MAARPRDRLAAVFFDLDGTLIDSEEVWNDAVRRLAASRGVVAAEPLLARTHGLEVMQALRLVHAEFGWHPGTLDADAAWLARQVAATFENGIVWRPGAQSLLSRLRTAGVPTALVTSTYRQLVDLILRRLEWEGFDAVVCGDEVRSPKPDPEPYLTAARLLGVDVRTCVAVEDSPKGAASARAAGCAVLYVSAMSPAPPGGDMAAVLTTLVGVDLATLTRLTHHHNGRSRSDHPVSD